MSLSNEELSLLSAILSMIDKREWPWLDHYIIANPHGFQVFARAVAESSDLNGLTLLHACMRKDAPIATVQLLLHLLPEGLSKADCSGRTPLHVAAGMGASLPCIQLLIQICPEAASMKDRDGKTALHLACDSSCELFEGDEGFTKPPPSYDVVHTLMRASPTTVHLEDGDGMNALEYAIISNAPIKVVKTLQKGTRDYFEKRKVHENESMERKGTGTSSPISIDDDAQTQMKFQPTASVSVCRSEGLEEVWGFLND